MHKLKLLIVFFLVTAFSALAQIPDNTSFLIKKELDKRGLTEEEATNALQAKGIDVKGMSPETLLLKQNEILDVLNELSSTKNPIDSQSAIQPVLKNVEPIKAPVLPEIKSIESKNAIYGHSLLVDGGIQVQSLTDGANAPETYVLGVGDQIRVTIFGISQADLLLTINESGFIAPTGIAQIYLKGLSLKEARKLIRNRFSVAYRFQSDEFAVTLQKARMINVNVFGEVKKSGSIQISALNSAINALVAAGGVTEIASVRNIELLRGDKREKIDLYAFLNNPSIQFRYDLQHNDIIYVPVAQKIINLEGAVKRPLFYELNGKEGLKELINYAGGVQYNANVELIQVERSMGLKPQLNEYSLKEVLAGKLVVDLFDGDVVRLKQSSLPLDEYTAIEGAVYYPGNYAWKDGQTLNEVLVKAQIKPQTSTDLYFIERTLNDGTKRNIKVLGKESTQFKLQSKDRILVFDKSVYANQMQLEVIGAVREPFKKSLEYTDQLKLSEVLDLAKGLLPTTSEWAYLRRQDLFEPNKYNYFTINLKSDKDFIIGAGDVLMVYDKNIYTYSANVHVSGAVRQAISSPFAPHLTIAQLINLAGRTLFQADLKRVDLFRLKYNGKHGSGYELIRLQLDSNYNVLNMPKNFSVLPFDHIVVRDKMNFDTSKQISVQGEVKYPGLYVLPAKNYRLSDLVQDAGGLNDFANRQQGLLVRSKNNIGPIGFNINKALRHKHSRKHNPFILAGDALTIYTNNNTVVIRTFATNYPVLQGKSNDLVNFFFSGSHSALWYLDRYAGGIKKEANKKTIAVAYPNGKVEGVKKRFFFFNKYPTVHPGGQIVVDLKSEKQANKKKEVDSDAIFTRTFQAISSMLTLLLLLKQL